MIQSTQRKNGTKWKRKLENRKKSRMEKKKKKITEALRMKLMMETAHTQTAIKTATSPSWTYRWRNWHRRNWRRRMDWKQEEKHRWSHGTDENSKNQMLDKKTHRRMKWRLAIRIASLPEERWVMKAAGWNLELSTKYKTHRAMGRPKKRWEDDINDFLRPERTEDEINNVERNNNERIKTAKDQEGWKKMENKFAIAAAAPPSAQKENGRLCMTPDADTMQSGKVPDSFQTQWLIQAKRLVSAWWSIPSRWCCEPSCWWCNATTILNFLKDFQRHEVVKIIAGDCQQTKMIQKFLTHGSWTEYEATLARPRFLRRPDWWAQEPATLFLPFV